MALPAIFAGLLALPWVGTALAGLLSLLGVSVIGLAFPWVNNLLLGGALFLAAVFVPDVSLYKGKKWGLGLKSVIALMALLIIVAGFLGVSPKVFGGTIVGQIGNVVAGEIPHAEPAENVVVGETAQELFGSALETTSMLNIGFVVAATFGLLIMYDRMVKK